MSTHAAAFAPCMATESERHPMIAMLTNLAKIERALSKLFHKASLFVFQWPNHSSNPSVPRKNWRSFWSTEIWPPGDGVATNLRKMIRHRSILLAAPKMPDIGTPSANAFASHCSRLLHFCICSHQRTKFVDDSSSRIFLAFCVCLWLVQPANLTSFL